MRPNTGTPYTTEEYTEMSMKRGLPLLGRKEIELVAHVAGYLCYDYVLAIAE
jgi:hypothetical protein